MTRPRKDEVCRRENWKRDVLPFPECLAWLDEATRWAIYRRDEFTCQICDELVDFRALPGGEGRPTIDHIVPRSEGGCDHEHNLRLVCHSCNVWRGNCRPATAKRVKGAACPT